MTHGLEGGVEGTVVEGAVGQLMIGYRQLLRLKRWTRPEDAGMGSVERHGPGLHKPYHGLLGALELLDRGPPPLSLP